MVKGQEVAMDTFIEEIGRDLFFLNNDYIFKYFNSTSGIYSKLAIDLKVIYNGGSSYSVYETEKGNLLTIVQWNKRDHYHIIPIGLAKVMAENILGKFDLLERHEEFSTSVYKTLFDANELPENEKLDSFLYYLGILIFDTLNFDIYNSVINVPENDNFMIDAVKHEFVYIDDDGYDESFEYEEVIYIITAAYNNPHISCCKVFESRETVTFSITVDDLINKAYNEFKTDKK